MNRHFITKEDFTPFKMTRATSDKRTNTQKNYARFEELIKKIGMWNVVREYGIDIRKCDGRCANRANSIYPCKFLHDADPDAESKIITVLKKLVCYHDLRGVQCPMPKCKFLHRTDSNEKKEEKRIMRERSNDQRTAIRKVAENENDTPFKSVERLSDSDTFFPTQPCIPLNLAKARFLRMSQNKDPEKDRNSLSAPNTPNLFPLSGAKKIMSPGNSPIVEGWKGYPQAKNLGVLNLNGSLSPCNVQGSTLRKKPCYIKSNASSPANREAWYEHMQSSYARQSATPNFKSCPSASVWANDPITVHCDDEDSSDDDTSSCNDSRCENASSCESIDSQGSDAVQQLATQLIPEPVKDLNFNEMQVRKTIANALNDAIQRLLQPDESGASSDRYG